jgi:hypothetical protein
MASREKAIQNVLYPAFNAIKVRKLGKDALPTKNVKSLIVLGFARGRFTSEYRIRKDLTNFSECETIFNVRNWTASTPVVSGPQWARVELHTRRDRR